MSSSQCKHMQASTQKQPQEEEPNIIFLLSNHKSHESNNAAFAHKNPDYQIDTPEAKKKKL